MWQTIFAGLSICCAFAYFALRLYKQFFAKEKACEGCVVHKTMESK